MTQQSSRIIVGKFGGTSMADATSIRRVANIIADKGITLTVVSAAAGVTNVLESISQNAHQEPWKHSEKEIDTLREQHMSIAEELGLGSESLMAITDLFDEAETLARGMQLLKDNPHGARDRLMSIGERASSVLLAHFLETEDDTTTHLLDARTIIITSDDHGQATPLYESSSKNAAKKIVPILQSGDRIITQGFIGRSKKGNTTTLGRGGSDFSAAIFAEAVGADELQIWSDVSGITSCDPRVVSNCLPLMELTYGEAAELALAGAKIIYPATIIPAERAKIPVFIKNTFEPDSVGTKITTKVSTQPLIRAVAIKANQYLITVSTPRMTAQYGFMAQLFSLFQKHRVNIDQVLTSETAVSMTVSERIAKHSELMDDLTELAEISIEPNIAMVSVVGNKITETPHVGKMILDAIYDEKKPITLRGLNQGANKHSFSVFVHNNDANECAVRLHDSLIKNGYLS